MTTYNKSVLFLTSAPECPGGIASVYKTLSKSLQEKGIKVYYTYGIKNSVLNHLARYFAYLKIINRYKIIHLNSPLSKRSYWRDMPYVVLLLLLRKKFVYHIHGGEETFYEEICNRKWLLRLTKLTYFKAQKIIVLGQVFIDKYSEIKYLPEQKWQVLPNPVENIYLTDNSSKSKLKKRNKIQILYLSRIDHKKGCEIAIQAFKLLKEKNTHYQYILNICGDGPLLKPMKELVKREKIENVIFHGYVSGEEKIIQFRNNNIFLFPTYYGEGLPVSILEAMAFGLPIISRPIGGIPDWVKPQLNGFIINSRQPSSFTNAIIDLIDSPDLLNNMAENNINIAKTYFSPEAIVSCYQKIYNEIN